MAIPIRTIDHVVIMTEDIERAIKFYCGVLGGNARYLERFRDGTLPVLPIELGQAVVNLQRLDNPAYIVANRLVSGGVDVCFRWGGTIAEAEQFLTAAGVEVIEGPVPRSAADGIWGKSVYFRDPDGNLLEFLSTAERSEPLVDDP
ncbi:MAG: VOC family protein [Pseudomonadota bacterium]